MDNRIARREFLQVSTAATAGLALPASGLAQAAEDKDKPVRIGIVGLGNRGSSLLRVLLTFPGVQVRGLCDIDTERLDRARDAVAKAGQEKPETYSQGEDAYKSLVQRDDLDAVVVATPWHWHAPMAVAGMKAGKYVAVEVPAAITLDECWDLVRTHEETGKPCMMLENWSFRRDNLAILNMIRKGLLGDIVHGHCSYSHDCCAWYFDGEGKPRWQGEYLSKRNASQYPTHALGPMVSWMDINCGDAFEYVTSTATRSSGINAYFARKYGPDHPNTKRKFTQGDVVTTVVRTYQGKTIVINNDMQLPRPYDNRWAVQGTLGIYNEQRNAVYLEGRSPKNHKWEPFTPYQEEFEHAWWKALRKGPAKLSHGGTDHLELQKFLAAVRNKTQTPIDVYDSVTMSAIIALSEKSIAQRSAPIDCPDFTHGKWKTRKPAFALDA